MWITTEMKNTIENIKLFGAMFIVPGIMFGTLSAVTYVGSSLGIAPFSDSNNKTVERINEARAHGVDWYTAEKKFGN